MEPLGTITAYFPFLDEETKSILQNIMEKSYDYYDFVKTLKELVLDTDSSDLVVYFAIHHAAQLFDLKAINEIGKKYSESPILLPNLFFASAVQGHVEDFENVRKAADDVLEMNPDDWLAIEMLFMKFEADMMRYPEIMYDTSNLDRIIDMIERNSEFGFYETTLYAYLSLRADFDGDTEDRIRCNNRAIQCARDNNDKIRLIHLLTRRAEIFESEDREKAREFLIEAGEIAEAMGTRVGHAAVLEQIGRLEITRGEYNSAIDHFLEAVSIRETMRMDNGTNSLWLSTLYNIVGEYESGLEWGKMTEDQFKHRPQLQHRAILNQVWSLLQMGKMTEAQVLLDTTRETILKSGQEASLAWLHFVTGLLESLEGDLTSAFSSIEEGLKIYEKRSGTLMMQVIFLYHLAQIEISSSEISTSVYPTLALLEDRATSEVLPGISGQVLVLKAEVALLQNDDATLRDCIKQLRPLTETSSMEFLVPYYDGLIKRV
ncbi:MAG: tetratricopeptide repeat protein [Promethearchaeota archaeon]